MTYYSLLYQGDKIGKYTILSDIKPGTRNSVYKAFIEGEREKKYYAIKAYPYEEQDDILAVNKEVDILNTLSKKECVICFLELITEEILAEVTDQQGNFTERKVKFLFAVMNFYGQLDLMSFFRSFQLPGSTAVKPLKIENIRQIFYKTLKTLAEVHKNGIVHHDIRPENFLVKSTDTLQIALSDFEYAAYLMEDEKIHQKCGSIRYMAPEILNEKPHDKSVDIWSIGVMIYYFAFARYPCMISNKDKNTKDVCDKINIYHDKIDFGKSESELFCKFRDLLKKFLEFDPEKRITAEEALKHEFFEDYTELECETKLFAEEISEIELEIIKSDSIEQTQIEGYVPKEHLQMDIKCAVCLKMFDRNDVIYVENEVFMCKQDYENYVKKKDLPQKFVDDYCERIINETFKPFIFHMNIDSQPEKNIFIDSEMMNNSLYLNEDFKYFCPNVTFHFEQSPSEIDFKKIIEILPNDMRITHIYKGSTFIVIVFITIKEVLNDEKDYREVIEQIKLKLNPPMKEPIVGNFDESVLSIPSNEDVENFFKKKSINIFQNTGILHKIDYEKAKKLVAEMLKSQRIENKNLKFIFDHFDIFESSEEQVRNDIEKNRFEFIITGETIIANKFYGQYEEVKNSLDENEISECFLYHGSPLKNHFGIVDQHFHERAFEYKIDSEDPGYYGIGTYATDDIFYAAMYSNNKFILSYNEMTSVICCRSIYNRTEVVNIEPTEKKGKKRINLLPYQGKQIDFETASNHGIHKILVGDSTHFYPIYEKDIEQNLIVAYEYVFPDIRQIIPISSFTIKRTDHFMIWFDNRGKKHQKKLKKIRDSIEVNIYMKNNITEYIDLIKKKKNNAMKIIISVDKIETAEKIINDTNAIDDINCVFMIYSKGENITKLSNDIKNILYTNSSSHIIKFSECGMNIESISNLSKELIEQYNIPMLIDLKEVTNENDPLKVLTFPKQ